MTNGSTKPKLIVRQATLQDLDGVHALSKSIYEQPFTKDMIRGQLSNFPEGQFIAEYDGKIVGHCATFVISGSIALKPHTWREITGDGFGSRHDPGGDYLYGMEVCVDKQYRRLRIGQRLYKARKQLCNDLELKGILFGGRIPGYAKKKRTYPQPEQYVEDVVASKITDTVLNFQLSNEFEYVEILPNYLPTDKESAGYAVLLKWKNPAVPEQVHKSSKQRGRLPDSIRIATVQFQMRKIKEEADFEKQIEYFVDVASGYKADFVVFPELVTLSLLSISDQRMQPAESIEWITRYTERYVSFMEKLAISYNINIIGGSHPTKKADGLVYNTAYVFLRDGSVHTQDKLHPTPNETHWWNIQGGKQLHAITTDCGPIGVQICYDSEFPETSRHLADQGALLLFVPFCTDERLGYLRVRYCCQARAVENQMYVIMSGTVGNLPDVENMDIHYAESCILTPCDFPFSREGVAATTAPNTEMIAFADLRLENLFVSRNSGTVQNLKDRRFDLYRTRWYGE